MKVENWRGAPAVVTQGRASTRYVTRSPIGINTAFSRFTVAGSRPPLTEHCQRRKRGYDMTKNSARNQTVSGGVDIGPISVSAQSGWNEGTKYHVGRQQDLLAALEPQGRDRQVSGGPVPVAALSVGVVWPGCCSLSGACSPPALTTLPARLQVTDSCSRRRTTRATPCARPTPRWGGAISTRSRRGCPPHRARRGPDHRRRARPGLDRSGDRGRPRTPSRARRLGLTQGNARPPPLQREPGQRDPNRV